MDEDFVGRDPLHIWDSWFKEAVDGKVIASLYRFTLYTFIWGH